ncbi:hypothetical protein PI124_g18120 [Phytophthora idaei]|nr:hypothetical protein PI125_g22510 [Phytophthora idaei]KAG3129991.1 hypothetical protein PI126_g20705 [Phytophthora idaei]KAG3236875.1 hypothetical protein PI124_g18120 [Phytophthora idaei]
MKKFLLQNKSNEPWLRVQEARTEMNRAQVQILSEAFPELTRKSRGSIGVAAAEARIKQRHIRLFCEEITTSIIDTALLALDYLMRTKMILAQNLHAIRNIVVEGKIAHNVLLPSSFTRQLRRRGDVSSIWGASLRNGFRSWKASRSCLLGARARSTPRSFSTSTDKPTGYGAKSV